MRTLFNVGVFSVLITTAACSVAADPDPTPGANHANRESVGATTSKLSSAALSFTGSYRLANEVQGVAAWTQLSLVSDGTFSAFAPCKVPACSAFRTTGTWAFDDGSSTLTMTYAATLQQSFTVSQGWDGGQGIELVSDTADEQLEYVAATCVVVADCAGQTVAGAGATTCGDGFAAQTACSSSVCDTLCKPIACATDADCSTTTVCYASTSGSFCTPPRAAGESCGFRVQNQPCAAGLQCTHVGGPLDSLTCVAGDPVAVSCGSDADCTDGSSCFFADGQCWGTGTCRPRAQICSQICGDSTSVCGCDGSTYCNPCLAAQSGVSIASNGPCAQ